MKIQSGGREFSLCFMTPTWGGDLGHFQWLRRSMEKAGLADVPHRVIVQTEDLDLFRPLAVNGVQLQSTADVLPPDIEQGRERESRLAERHGHTITKFRGSLNKRFGWCPAVRYAGWQIQQITKLQAAAESTYDVTVVLDSDVLITRPFDLRLFVPDGRVAVFEAHYVTPQSPGLSWKWHVTSSRLLKQPIAPNRPANGYWSPPFVFDRNTVRALHQWLETEYRLPWHRMLLDQPLSSWSEGSIYTMFARAYGDDSRLTFTGNPHYRSLHSIEHRQNYEAFIQAVVSEPAAYFMNIQSDRRVRRRWPVEFYDAVLSRHFAL